MKVLLLWLAAALIIIVMTRVSNLCGSVIHANSRKQSEVYQKEEEEEEDDDDDEEEAKRSPSPFCLTYRSWAGKSMD